jgi:hypothetical protein
LPSYLEETAINAMARMPNVLAIVSSSCVGVIGAAHNEQVQNRIASTRSKLHLQQ